MLVVEAMREAMQATSKSPCCTPAGSVSVCVVLVVVTGVLIPTNDHAANATAAGVERMALAVTSAPSR